MRIRLGYRCEDTEDFVYEYPKTLTEAKKLALEYALLNKFASIWIIYFKNYYPLDVKDISIYYSCFGNDMKITVHSLGGKFDSITETANFILPDKKED